MAHYTFTASSDVRVMIQRCHGDLTVVGEDRQDVVVRGDRSVSDHVTQNENELTISGGQGDLYIHVPIGATVVAARVSGDVEVTNIAGAEFQSVGGDVSVSDVGAISVENVGGDFEAELRDGPATVGRVGGDVEVRQASALQLGTVGGDAEIDALGELAALGRVGGDLALRWSGRLRESMGVLVGGDAEIEIGDEATGTLTATVGGDVSGDGLRPTWNGQDEDDERVPGDHGHWNLEAGGGQLVVTFGDAETTLTLTVGGDLELRGGNAKSATFNGMPSPSFGGEFAAIGDEMRRFGREMKNMGRQIAREVAREVRTSTRSTGPGPRPRVQVQFNDKSFQFDAEQIDRLTREAREAAASGVARAQEAVERALVNMVSQRERQRGVPPAPRPPQGGPGVPPAPPRPSYTGQTVRIEREAPVATRSPEDVQEEKLAILRMVSEGRLAIDEAEAMLRALEDRG